MANAEEKELESIIKETEAPKRAAKKDNVVVKVAKLTGRTISSLKTKIKEKRLSKAIDKFNENRVKMVKNLKKAISLDEKKAKGEEIKDSQIVAAYEAAAYYNKKMAKYSVKLLKNDIKKIAQVSKPKPLRLPRVIRAKVGWVADRLDSFHEWNKTRINKKQAVKDIEAGTKDYITNSLEGAVFKDRDNAVLREKIDTGVIKNLKVDKKADNFDDKIANLRKFISEDGKKPLFPEEELVTKERTNTDVPPIEPVPSVKKEQTKVTTEDLLGNLGKKAAQVEKKDDVKETPVTQESTKDDTKPQRRVTVDDLLNNLNKKESSAAKNNDSNAQTKVTAEDLKTNLGSTSKVGENTSGVKNDTSNAVDNSKSQEPTREEPVAVLSEEDKKNINNRKKEVATITELGKRIENLEKQVKHINDPETNALIHGYIEGLKTELDAVIEKSTVKKENVEVKNSEPASVSNSENNKEETETVKNNENEVSSLEPIPVEGRVVDEDVQYQPIQPTSTDNNLDKSNNNMKNVEVKPSESRRAEQIATPVALRLTPQDIKNMEERNKKAQEQIVNLRQQRQDLEAQRDMLKQYIEVAENTRVAELQAQEMAKSNATLAGEVAELSNQAAAFDSNLGRTK